MLPLVSTIPLGSSAVTALGIGGTHCDSKICQVDQFCSRFHNDCESCEPVCDESSHNFDRVLCLSDCQSYLHYQKDVKLSEFAGKLQALDSETLLFTAEIKNLKIYLTVTFVLVVLLLILFFAVNGSRIFSLCMRSMTALKPTAKKNKPVPEPVTMANPHTVSPRMRPKLQTINNNQNHLNRSSSIFTVTGTEFDAKTVSTPISTRYPAEDTLTSDATVTADYSYDNKALQLTPVNEEKPRIETTF